MESYSHLGKNQQMNKNKKKGISFCFAFLCFLNVTFIFIPLKSQSVHLAASYRKMTTDVASSCDKYLIAELHASPWKDAPASSRLQGTSVLHHWLRASQKHYLLVHWNHTTLHLVEVGFNWQLGPQLVLKTTCDLTWYEFKFTLSWLSMGSP